MAIDFYEREVERLRVRFNSVFGDRPIGDLWSRYASILAICRVGMLVQSIRDSTDEKQTQEWAREFGRIRDALNQFFDLAATAKKRRRHALERNHQQAAAGG